MSRPLNVRPEVRVDVREAFCWYEAQQPGLGQEFLAELRATLVRIAQMPERFGRVYRSLRAAQTSRFPYVVYFQIKRDKVLIVAVMHGKRASREWRRRLR